MFDYQRVYSILANWWLTYPSEKYESDWIIIPTIGENKTCSKPPTSYYSPMYGYSNPIEITITVWVKHGETVKYFGHLGMIRRKKKHDSAEGEE